MSITVGTEAAAFLRACETIHFLLEQGGTLHPDDRAVIEVSMTDLRAKLETYT